MGWRFIWRMGGSDFLRGFDFWKKRGVGDFRAGMGFLCQETL